VPLTDKIGDQAERRIRARQEKRQSPWFGLGMFGLIGWSVALPTLGGIALGIWVDRHWPGTISWTITFLFVGLACGCANAWYWIRQERDKKD